MERVYTISQVAENLSVSSGTVRNWEKELGDFITVSRDETGARIYTDSDIETLRKISQLRYKGLSLAAIRDVFATFSGREDGKVTNALIPLRETNYISQQNPLEQLVQGLQERFRNMQEENEHLKQELRLMREEVAAVAQTQSKTNEMLEELVTKSRSDTHKRKKKFLGIF